MRASSFSKSFLKGGRKATFRLMALAVITLWLILAYLVPSWSDIESLERMKQVQRKFDERQKKLKTTFKLEEKKNVILGENEISHDENSLSKKKKSLKDKLRPKLVDRYSGKEIKKEDWRDDITLAKSNADIEKREDGYRIFAFNTLVSDRIGFRRKDPFEDPRHEQCLRKEYPRKLPTASVIICYFHEDFTVLLRTVYSVLDKSRPRDSLKEIILINDRSDIDISDNLTSHLKAEGLWENPVYLYTPPERLGLIRARIFGSRKASGNVLVFLDSHVEAAVGWLEPLLTPIAEDRTKVVTPIIDIISADTFGYTKSPLVRGGFNWGLHFKWDSVKKSELPSLASFAEPIKSPTMAGGLFAIEREYFKELGEYDSGLEVWGGENLEISFRIWMCGGSLEIVPCSRVGHVFRKRRPYGNGENVKGEDSMIRNSLRVAKVWMDDYIKYFYEINPNAESMDPGDLSERTRLRQSLGCKNFEWYLKNVYPELKTPDELQDHVAKKLSTLERNEPWNKRSRNYLRRFNLGFKDTNLCVRSEGDYSTKKSALILGPCHRHKKEFAWSETDKEELVLSGLLCMDSGGKDRRPRLQKCHELKGSQEWKMRFRESSPDANTHHAIFNMASGLCLSTENEKTNSGVKLSLAVCSDSSYLWKVHMFTKS